MLDCLLSGTRQPASNRLTDTIIRSALVQRRPRQNLVRH